MNFPAGIVLGVGISTGVTTALCAVLTWLVLANTVSETMIGYVSIGILLLATTLGAVVASSKIKRRRMLVCLLTGAAFFAVLLVATAVFFGGQYQGVAASLITLSVGSVGAGLLGLKREGGYKKRRTKIKTR